MVEIYATIGSAIALVAAQVGSVVLICAILTSKRDTVDDTAVESQRSITL